MKNNNLQIFNGQYTGNQIVSVPAKVCLASHFQRPISEKSVTNIIRNFDRNKVKPIVLSKRNGKYYVVDGQHTLTALRRLFGENVVVTAIIIEELTLQQEAEYFVKQYDGSHRLTSLDMFKGRLVYEDKAQQMESVAKSHGLRIKTSGTKGKNTIVAIRQYEKMWDKLGKNGTHKALTLIKRAWGDDLNAYDGKILSGMTMFIDVFKREIDDNIFVRNLSKVSPKEIIRNAESRRCSTKQAALATEIWFIYNKRLGAKNKLSDNIR